MSRSRRGGGGGGGKLGQVAFGIFVLALLVAIYQIPYDPGVKGIAEVAESKAEHAEEWAAGIAPGIEEWVVDLIRGGREEPTSVGIPDGEGYDSSSGNGGGNDLGTYEGSPGGGGTAGNDLGTYEGSPSTGGSGNNVGTYESSATTEALNGLAVGEQSVKYNRNEWKHWSTVRSCLDVRQAVLIRDAAPGTVVMLDKNNAETKDTNAGCKVVSGVWVDPYSGAEITDPRALDIDHMIPLGYAAAHNGQEFSADKKKQYANDMSNPYHLLAVSAKENRSKSDRGPSEYMPPNAAHHCAYVSNWTNISKNYGLSVSQKDKETIASVLATC